MTLGVMETIRFLYEQCKKESKCEDAKKEMEQLIQEIRIMLEEDADIKRLFIGKTGAGPQVEIAGVGKVSLEEAEKLIGKDVRWSRGGSETKIALPENVAQLKHIFREEKGHIIDTPNNRSKILDVANDKKII